MEPAWVLGTFYGVSNHDSGATTLTPEVRRISACMMRAHAHMRGGMKGVGACS